MNDLLVFAAHNTIVALAFALLVYGLTRVWRNPPVAHAMWLLVLIKLVAPPVWRVEWSALRPPEATYASESIDADISSHQAQPPEARPDFVDPPIASAPAADSATSAMAPDLGAQRWLSWGRAQSALVFVWLGGACLCALVAVTRIVRFERQLRDTLPASERLQQLTVEIAAKLGVRRAPLVRYVECAAIPLLWRLGRRATIVLPLRLAHELDEQQIALVLAHELAHLRRRDDWVRLVELIISTIYWWNPLVWVVRRQIHQAEDLCCDAWVRWAFPNHAKLYAEVVLNVAESVGAPEVAARALPASQFLSTLSLKARIEMILKSQFAPRVSRKSTFVIALLAFLVLPWFVQGTKTTAQASPNDDALADEDYIEQLRDLSAKSIAAEEKLDTARDKLQDTDRMLRKGYVTNSMRDSQAVAVQRATIELQATEAAITALEKSKPRGMPDSKEAKRVLKKQSIEHGYAWFGFGQTGKPDAPTTSEFPYAVKFEQGATRFLKNDNITILEVRGTAETFSPGNIYWIKGTYKLASHEKATLAAYTTAMESKDGRSYSYSVQTTAVDRGDGSFTLFLPMPYKGWPHVSFYSVDKGEGFGGNYFGTGDSVLKRWWGEKDTDPKATGAPDESSKADDASDAQKKPASSRTTRR